MQNMLWVHTGCNSDAAKGCKGADDGLTHGQLLLIKIGKRLVHKMMGGWEHKLRQVVKNWKSPNFGAGLTVKEESVQSKCIKHNHRMGAPKI